jgi:tetratricopeptide (TPR) repeat protein
MTRAAMTIVVLALATGAWAQQPTTKEPPAQSGTAQPATPAVGKRPPQAKTQPEFEAYKTAAATQDPAALLKATDDFAAKFPDSELRIILYKTAMRGFQQANDGDNMMETGRKVLKIDPDDPEALVGVAEVLAERTRDSDLDKDQRLDEALKLAQRATETVDTDIAVPAGTPQDKIDAYKGFLRSSAFSIMGTIQYNKDKYPEAESYYRKSIDAYPSQPDPVAVLRLALSLDKQEKYPEALKEANHAVELTQDSTNIGKLARQEKDRLAKLTSGGAPVAPPKPPAGDPPPKK